MRRKFCGNSGLLRLVAAGCVLAVLWLVILPWLGSRPALKQRMEFLGSRGVDPSAMFYTDLELMPAVYARTTCSVRKNRRLFYCPQAE